MDAERNDTTSEIEEIISILQEVEAVLGLADDAAVAEEETEAA